VNAASYVNQQFNQYQEYQFNKVVAVAEQDVSMNFYFQQYYSANYQMILEYSSYYGQPQFFDVIVYAGYDYTQVVSARQVNSTTIERALF
jgi:hypothetical protein